MNKNTLIALGGGISVAVLFLALTTKNPLEAIQVFFTAPFSSLFYFGNMLNVASLLLIAGIGTECSLKVGTFNLGGTGQIYIGGFVTAVILVYMPQSFMSIPVALCAALAASALMTLLPAVLRVYRKTTEILTTFLLSSALIPLVDYFVAVPLRDQSKNLLATPFIADKFRLHSLLPPSNFNISFFIALAIFFLAVLLLQATVIGYKMRVTGIAPEFAEYVGLGNKRIMILGMTLSGALHGLCGFFAVIGTYFTCYQGFVGNMGWSALAAALMAKKQVAYILPFSLLFAYLSVSSDKAIVSSSFSFDLSSLIQGAVFLFLAINAFSNKTKKKQKGLV